MPHKAYFWLVFGVSDVLVMLPLKCEDKKKKTEAITSAFIERLMLGFIIPNISLGMHPAYIGNYLTPTLLNDTILIH